MDESRVLGRLDRIDALDRTSAPPGELLAELRDLLREAEEQARARTSETSDGEEVDGRPARRVLGT
jgi:hypothetical protein